MLAHQLKQVQKATRCLQVVDGSNERPSEVLAFLLEFCPPGEEGTAFFRAAFTMRLPVAIHAYPARTELKELALWKTGFPSRPVLGRLREFSTRSRLLVKEHIILDFFKN